MNRLNAPRNRSPAASLQAHIAASQRKPPSDMPALHVLVAVEQGRIAILAGTLEALDICERGDDQRPGFGRRELLDRRLRTDAEKKKRGGGYYTCRQV